MKFLVKPISDKFEGGCFGNSQAKLDFNGQSGCNPKFQPIYAYCPRRG